jgi:hypothetical protein
MDFVLNGLPLHVLMVHAVIVLVPLAALATVLSLVWPAARYRLGLVTPILAFAVLALVPVTMAAGSWLQARVGDTPAVRTHAGLAVSLLPWVIALFIAAVLQWLVFRRQGAGLRALRRRLGAGGYRAVTVLGLVAGLLVSAGSVADLAIIGEAGTRAVWEGVFSDVPLPGR